MDKNFWRIKGCKSFPQEIGAQLDEAWEVYTQACAEAGVPPVTHDELRILMRRVWVYSDFVAETTQRHPELFYELCRSGSLFADKPFHRYLAELRELLEPLRDDNALMRALRIFRRREMLRIAWRDLAGWAELPETLQNLTFLADACVRVSLDKLYAEFTKDYGVPAGASHEVQPLIVIGMGKLGAFELNFSSDIDLIFAYAEEGVTSGPKEIDNEMFFARLGQRLIGLLERITSDGAVFRVDMRLRPYGDSGPLAMSFSAMEHYYQLHGRDWERYAWVKGRVMTGDTESARQLMASLKPFVYRRYLDFGAFEALRDMKAMIAQQVVRKGMDNNVKLGPGGIREVEFIGQVFQLIRGGREPRLQARPILEILGALGALGYLPQFTVLQLIQAYVFLRQVENRLQAFSDEQTHELPQNEQDRVRVAWSMGFSDWSVFRRALEKQMQTVHSHFEQVFVAPQSDADGRGSDETYSAIWRGVADNDDALAYFSKAGFKAASDTLASMNSLRDSSRYRGLSANGRTRMDRLIPLLLGAVASQNNPDETLQRVLSVIESIAKRTAYLALLVEHPVALSQLVKLCGASPWVSEFLAHHPLLLDELLDPRELYMPLQRTALEKEAAELLRAVADGDLEQEMEILRQFAHTAMFRVAAADVASQMPLMVVSDHLTEIAEIVLNHVLQGAWRHLTKRHGAPLVQDGKDYRPVGFAIVAYGKLGGIELGYGSDLDVVFLHDSHGDQAFTAGPAKIDNHVFFARLGQRIIHMLTAFTPSGTLYDVDTRLRPSGASGLLVTSIESYAGYQRESAWTWEHQALTRARVVAGDQSIAVEFNRLREQVLSRKRDFVKLRQDVVEMREKMRSELGQKDPDLFDLKQDEGGITDIEFLVQYAVLRWSYRYPELMRWTDNIRVLETLSNVGLITASETQVLQEAYRVLRHEIHARTLQKTPTRVVSDPFTQWRTRVRDMWQKIVIDGLWDAE